MGNSLTITHISDLMIKTYWKMLMNCDQIYLWNPIWTAFISFYALKSSVRINESISWELIDCVKFIIKSYTLLFL